MAVLLTLNVMHILVGYLKNIASESSKFRRSKLRRCVPTLTCECGVPKNMKGFRNYESFHLRNSIMIEFLYSFLKTDFYLISWLVAQY